MKRIILFLLFLLLIVFSWAEKKESNKQITFEFKKGSFTLKSYPKDYKFVYPVLTLSDGVEEHTFEFKIGTEIFRDKSESGYLLLRIWDKRFAAFYSAAYEMVDLQRKIIFPVVTDVIFDLKTERDDVLIGVQRIPKDSHISYHGKMEGDLLQYYDFDYYESTNVLFVIVFDFQVGRYYRINLTSGTDLPDWNLYFVEASRKKWERLFFVKGDTLHYPLDQDGKIMTQYRFSDILRRGRPKKKRK